jgi:hypothetical protein
MWLLHTKKRELRFCIYSPAGQFARYVKCEEKLFESIETENLWIISGCLVEKILYGTSESFLCFFTYNVLFLMKG